MVFKKHIFPASSTGDRGFAFQAKPWGARSPKASDRNIHLWWKSRHIATSPRVLRRLASIVCYSTVRMRRMTQYTASGMRLRKLLCPTTFIFLGRFTKNSYQLFFPRLPATSTKKPETTYFDLFSAVFLYIFHKIGCFQLTTCSPDFGAFCWIFHVFFIVFWKSLFFAYCDANFEGWPLFGQPLGYSFLLDKLEFVAQSNWNLLCLSVRSCQYFFCFCYILFN